MTKTKTFAQCNSAVLEDTPLEIVSEIISACSDAKGRDITVLDVQDVFDIADYFLIVSGRSDRQVQGICNRVVKDLERFGVKPNFVEGYEEGHWVLLDFDDIVLHIFYEPTREQYDLEGLWSNARKLVVDTDKAGREVLRAA